LQNEFVKTLRRYLGNLQVHTGTIDGVWRPLKSAIPDQVVTKKCKKKVETNSSLWTYIRAWQWRWEVCQTGDACMKATGIELSHMAKICNVVVLKHEHPIQTDFIVKRRKTYRSQCNYVQNGDSHHIKHCKTQHFNKILGCKMLVSWGRFPIRRVVYGINVGYVGKYTSPN